MNWNVTYRSKDGKRSIKGYEAGSREELFNRLTLEGIAVLSVKQNELKPSAKNIIANRKLPPKRHLAFFFIIAIFVLGVGVTLYVLLHDSRNANTEFTSPKTVKKAISTVFQSQTTNFKNDTAPKPKLPKGKLYDIKGNIINVPKNPWGQPIPPELEYKPIWEYTTEDYAKVDPGYLKRHKAHLERQAAIPWKTDADRQLAILLFAKDGNTGLLPPFNRRFVDQFLKSIETPIVTTQEDSPELQEQKRQMNEVKLYLKERLDAGADIVEILNEEYKNAKKVHALRQNLQEELRRLEKTATSVEEVQDYINAANKMLDEYGAKHVGLPLTLTRLRLEKSAASDNK